MEELEDSEAIWNRDAVWTIVDQAGGVGIGGATSKQEARTRESRYTGDDVGNQ